MLEIVAGDFRFAGRVEEEWAPATVAAFRRLLPLESRIIHARWSGEACWVPLGDLGDTHYLSLVLRFGGEHQNLQPIEGP